MKKLIVMFLTMVTALCLCFGLAACELFDFSSNSKSDDGENQAQTDNGSDDDSENNTGSGSGDNTGSGSGDMGDTGDTHVHTFIYMEAVAATCTEAGNTAYYYCSECGKYFSDGEAETEISLSDTIIAALGHDYESAVTTEATCTTQGITTYTCTVCSDTYTETVAKTAHTYNDGVVTKEPTCSEEGVKTYTCSVCGDSYTETIAKTAHTYEAVVTLPTCTGQGYTTYTCSVCGNSYVSDYTDALEHAYSGYSSNENGHWQTCTACGEKTASEGHTFSNDICTVCGYEKFNGSEGLAYGLSSDGTSYTVVGIGTCTDKELVIPSSYKNLPVTSIGNWAFVACISLTSVTIGSGVTSIGDDAFEYCFSLTSVTIGSGVMSIGSYAFYDCYKLIEVYNLSSLNITAGSTNNGYVAYHAKNVYMAKSGSSKLFMLNDYQFYNNNGTYYLMGYMGTDTVLTLPDFVNGSTYSIYPFAFYYCTNLTSVTIGSGVTSIGNYAFGDCYKLIEVYNLSSLSITAGSTNNGYVAYYAKNVYTATSGSSKLFMLNDYQFYNDNGTYYLMSYTGMDTVLTLPDSVNGSTYSIYQYALAYCWLLTSVTIGSGVTSIEDYAFAYCVSLTSVTIESGVTSIGSGAFEDCWSLTSTTIPNSVTSIGEYAFYDCTNLTSITIGKGVTSIGEGAFRYCDKLIEVYNLSSLNITAGSTNNGYVAYYAKDVYSVTSGSSKLFMLNDYQFYNDNGTYYLMGYMGTDTILTLPDSVNGSTYSIYQYAFYNCSSLTSVTIGNSVTSIGGSAFYDCDSLTSVTIGNSVTSIGGSAFYDCDSLTSVTIGNGVTSIGNSAFSGCSSLTSVTIGSGVKIIGEDVFDSCTSLTSVYYSGTASDWSAISIESDNTNLTNATIYYYAQNDGTTTAAGNYWYYDGEGNIKTWSIE